MDGTDFELARREVVEDLAGRRMPTVREADAAEFHEVYHGDPGTFAQCVHNVGAAMSEAADAIARLYLLLPDPDAPELGSGGEARP